MFISFHGFLHCHFFYFGVVDSKFNLDFSRYCALKKKKSGEKLLVEKIQAAIFLFGLGILKNIQNKAT